MATCSWCHQEMKTASSCSVEALHRDGRPIEMVPWGDERPRWSDGRVACGDCGVAPGGFHHPGCDIQRCGLCGGQMMTCGCRFDEDGPDEEDDDDFDDDVDLVVEVREGG